MITGLIVGLVAGVALGVVVGLLIRADQATAARTAEARLADVLAPNRATEPPRSRLGAGPAGREQQRSRRPPDGCSPDCRADLDHERQAGRAAGRRPSRRPASS